MPTELGLLRNSWKRLFGNKAWFTAKEPSKAPPGCEQCRVQSLFVGLIEKTYGEPDIPRGEAPCPESISQDPELDQLEREAWDMIKGANR